MTDIIITILLVAVIGAAIYYIIKSKKNGAKCIGCPEGCKCSKSHEKTSESSCDCGCHGDTEK